MICGLVLKMSYYCNSTCCPSRLLSATFFFASELQKSILTQQNMCPILNTMCLYVTQKQKEITYTGIKRFSMQFSRQDCGIPGH